MAEREVRFTSPSNEEASNFSKKKDGKELGAENVTEEPTPMVAKKEKKGMDALPFEPHDCLSRKAALCGLAG